MVACVVLIILLSKKHNEAPKVQMSCGSYHFTVTYKVNCTCYTFAIRSQSVLTTNSTGCVYNVQHSTQARHNFLRHALLSCSEILTYQLLGSQLYIFMSTEKSRLPAIAIDREVSKSRHNSRTRLRMQVLNVEK